MRLALVSACTTESADGIADYCQELVRALNTFGGVSAELFGLNPAGGLCAGGLNGRAGDARHNISDQVLCGYDCILLQYNPFMYGRRGFAGWLVRRCRQWRCLKPRPILALVIHETFVGMDSWRSAVMSVWQRLQLHEVARLGDVAFVTCEAWREHLRWPLVRVPVLDLPVGSTIPDMRSARLTERAALGLVSDEDLVIATFGTSHPARLRTHIEAAIEGIASVGRQVWFLNLGAGAPLPVTVPPGVRVYSPGCLPAVDLARKLATADLFLAPFVDGVSTRRTTLMAALQHGVAVVATDGASTDRVLREAGDSLRLVPATARQLFVEAARALANDLAERRQVGARGAELYAAHFAWSTISGRLVQCLRTVC